MGPSDTKNPSLMSLNFIMVQNSRAWKVPESFTHDRYTSTMHDLFSPSPNQERAIGLIVNALKSI